MLLLLVGVVGNSVTSDSFVCLDCCCDLLSWLFGLFCVTVVVEIRLTISISSLVGGGGVCIIVVSVLLLSDLEDCPCCINSEFSIVKDNKNYQSSPRSHG